MKTGGEYVINGSKCFITNAPVADLLVVFANAAPGKGARGISVFVVPRNAPGVTIGKIEDKMGHRASSTAEIFFEDVHIPADNMLGRVGHGFLAAMKTFDRTRPAVGGRGCGARQSRPRIRR